jgi:hypothetical protein
VRRYRSRIGSLQSPEVKKNGKGEQWQHNTCRDD